MTKEERLKAAEAYVKKRYGWISEEQSKVFKSHFLAGAEAEAEGKWISVSDMLPEYGVKVIVFGEHQRINPQMGGAYISITERQNLKATLLEKHREKYQCDNEFKGMRYVTHWQTLPSPPLNQQ